MSAGNRPKGPRIPFKEQLAFVCVFMWALKVYDLLDATDHPLFVMDPVPNVWTYALLLATALGIFPALLMLAEALGLDDNPADGPRRSPRRRVTVDELAPKKPPAARDRSNPKA